MKGENNMIYAQRFILIRGKINKFGKLGSLPFVEYFKTESEEVFNRFNERKTIKYERVPYSLQFEGIEPDRLYADRVSWERFKEGRPV